MIYGYYILCLITLIYFFTLIWSITGFIKLKNKTLIIDNNLSNEFISIIVPIRNEENTIENCLNSIINQQYKKDYFEVLIINDHSTDNTTLIVNNFIKKHDFNIKLISLTNTTNKKEALKFGIQNAKYPIIATTDGDCVVPKKWLTNIAAHLNNDDMLIGPIVFKINDGFLANFQILDMLAIQGLQFGALGHGVPILNNAANLSYFKKSINNVDGFDNFKTPSGDDIFLLEKFKLNGKKIKGLLSKSFIVETVSENSFASLLHQRLRWASKSKYYTNNWLIFFSSIVFIQNITILLIYLGVVFAKNYSLNLIFLLYSKWLIDFILLFLVADFYDRKKSLLYFILVQLIYPIYIVFIAIASMFINFEWKGREFNG